MYGAHRTHNATVNPTPASGEHTSWLLLRMHAQSQGKASILLEQRWEGSIMYPPLPSHILTIPIRAYLGMGMTTHINLRTRHLEQDQGHHITAEMTEAATQRTSNGLARVLSVPRMWGEALVEGNAWNRDIPRCAIRYRSESTKCGKEIIVLSAMEPASVAQKLI
jgi:hypothetical protein